MRPAICSALSMPRDGTDRITLSVKLTDMLSSALERIAETEGRPLFRQAEIFLEDVIEADRQEKIYRLRSETADHGIPCVGPWKICMSYKDFAHLERRAHESGQTLSSQAREWLWVGVEGYDSFDRGLSYRKEEFVRRLRKKQEERRLAIALANP